MGATLGSVDPALDNGRAAAVARADVEDFLYREAALLDSWELMEWLELLTDDAVYEIPAPDRPNEDPGQTFSLIHDHREMIEQRAIRLTKLQAYAEQPRSRTRRFISNVRIDSTAGDELMVAANFMVSRIRREHVTYVGRYEYVLVVTDAGLRIKYRKAIVDHFALNPHGKISILL
ncbi:aromatic-ring-hydroxylating dioxygenase subunit beta [Sporichthya brevicatena]|uniref:Aromatic-ring-hydroxylating dioxygenase subunit beta n=1 Tax=Sporichthya brevicatena TaxID=171442 RepID=A0ABP3RIM2_9ACTN